MTSQCKMFSHVVKMECCVLPPWGKPACIDIRLASQYERTWRLLIEVAFALYCIAYNTDPNLPHKSLYVTRQVIRVLQ